MTLYNVCHDPPVLFHEERVHRDVGPWLLRLPGPVLGAPDCGADITDRAVPVSQHQVSLQHLLAVDRQHAGQVPAPHLALQGELVAGEVKEGELTEPETGGQSSVKLDKSLLNVQPSLVQQLDLHRL